MVKKKEPPVARGIVDTCQYVYFRVLLLDGCRFSFLKMRNENPKTPRWGDLKPVLANFSFDWRDEEDRQYDMSFSSLENVFPSSSSFLMQPISFVREKDLSILPIDIHPGSVRKIFNHTVQ